MRTRPLGKTGVELTSIGLGTWAIGGPWAWGWGPQDDAQSIAAIQRAIELGINWIDTAPCYGLGHAEELVARAIGDRRRDLFLVTKCGQVWDEQGNFRTDDSPENIRRECDESLRRLRTDRIDLYLIHWPDPRTPVEASWEAMARLKEEGKVRHIGVSNFGRELLERCARVHPVEALQPALNLFDRKVEAEVLPWCAAHGAGVITYGSIGYGLLSGRFTRESLEGLAPDDWRRRYAVFQRPLADKVLGYVDRLRALAARLGAPLSALATAWVLTRPAIAGAIVGARRPEQIEELAQGADLTLPEGMLAEIDAIWRDALGGEEIPEL